MRWSNKQINKTHASRFTLHPALGFTLAEVLITLGIIGIVAALTIPTLMANYQKQQYVVGLKRAYSEFNQALTSLADDYGCTGDLKCTELFKDSGDYKADNLKLGNALGKYFKIVKNCDVTQADCIPSSISDNLDGSDRYDPTGWLGNAYRFITADGILYSVSSNEADCDGDVTQPHVSQICGWLTVDVNGLQGPNDAGRDMFSFMITNGKGPLLYPQGGKESSWWQNDDGTPNSCDSSVGNDGNNCAGRIMEQGWQMNYDFNTYKAPDNGGGPN